MRTKAAALVAVLVLLMIGCASGTAGTRGTRSSLDELSREDILATNAPDALAAIRQLRPGWLRQRGSASINRPTPRLVYVDNQRYGGLESLRQIAAESIQRMQFLDSSEATQRFGTGHVNGAILIFTR